VVNNGAVARINLVPQRREFYELYSRQAANVEEIATALAQLLDHYPEEADSRIRGIKELEHEGDRLTHDVIDLLNRTFVTPFDREDMYRLAGALDDICDHVDEAAAKLVSLGIDAIRAPARAQAGILCRAAGKLREAIEGLEGFKVERRRLIELRELEDEGDRVADQGISELFHGGEDALTIIRWKDVYERLEDALDSCENAADVLEAILVKNR
jgi:predicted phosphate transport protein (TIGR00153 family)